MTTHNRLTVILLLGTTQTLGWASSFYHPAILGDRIAERPGGVEHVVLRRLFRRACSLGARGTTCRPHRGRRRPRGARRFELDPCDRTRCAGLCAFAGDVVVGQADPRPRDATRAKARGRTFRWSRPLGADGRPSGDGCGGDASSRIGACGAAESRHGYPRSSLPVRPWSSFSPAVVCAARSGMCQ